MAAAAPSPPIARNLAARHFGHRRSSDETSSISESGRRSSRSVVPPRRRISRAMLRALELIVHLDSSIPRTVAERKFSTSCRARWVRGLPSVRTRKSFSRASLGCILQNPLRCSMKIRSFARALGRASARSSHPTSPLSNRRLKVIGAAGGVSTLSGETFNSAFALAVWRTAGQQPTSRRKRLRPQ